MKPGEIVNRDGKVIGEHQGLSFYTIGQRKGLGVTSSEPQYVLAKYAGSNQIVVGVGSELGQNELIVENVHWVSGTAPEDGFRAEVKIRYSAREAWAEIKRCKSGCVHVRFDQPQRDITPGQAAVIYDGEVVLGGGLIIQNECV